MKTPENDPFRFASLSAAHRTLGLPPPLHPLISLVNSATTPVAGASVSRAHVPSFYRTSYGPG